ncbi:MAG TPA: hypothetical protein VGY57_15240 [Vicinamibacterales bacterium]|nr:hypothetical protein [Vicinamibacterales bacterium]
MAQQDGVVEHASHFDETDLEMPLTNALKQHQRTREMASPREQRNHNPIRRFLKKYSVQYNEPYAEMSPETMRLFIDCDWPGNVRELEELVKRAVALGKIREHGLDKVS